MIGSLTDTFIQHTFPYVYPMLGIMLDMKDAVVCNTDKGLFLQGDIRLVSK